MGYVDVNTLLGIVHLTPLRRVPMTLLSCPKGCISEEISVIFDLQTCFAFRRNIRNTYTEKIKPEQLTESLECIFFHLLSVFYSVLRNWNGTEGPAIFCLSRYGTVVHSGSSSGSGFGSGSNSKWITKVKKWKIKNEMITCWETMLS